MNRFGIALAAIVPGSPAAAAVADSRGANIEKACDRTSATYDEGRCYEMRAAYGDYQEIVDDLEVKVLGLAPYQKYFLGFAYFGLSGRTGAQSLRCFYTTRAKANLEAFLVDRQKLYGAQQTFGTSNEAKYTYFAARALEAANKVTGCEESGESLASLERFGRRFLTDRVQDLFYKYRNGGSELTGLDTLFKEKLGTLEGAMRGFVSNVSRMESDFGLVLGELESGKTSLVNLQSAINEKWRVGAVTSTLDAASGYPVFEYTAAMDDLQTDIGTQTTSYQALQRETGSLGRIQHDIDAILARAQASNTADYMRKRAEMIERLNTLSTALLRANHFTTEVLRGTGVTAISDVSQTEGSALDANWNSIETAWKSKKPNCNLTPRKWYCQ